MLGSGSPLWPLFFVFNFFSFLIEIFFSIVACCGVEYVKEFFVWKYISVSLYAYAFVIRVRMRVELVFWRVMRGQCWKKKTKQQEEMLRCKNIVEENLFGSSFTRVHVYVHCRCFCYNLCFLIATISVYSSIRVTVNIATLNNSYNTT